MSKQTRAKSWRWSAQGIETRPSTALQFANELAEETSFADIRLGNTRTGVVLSVAPHALGKKVTFKKETISVEDRDCQKSRIINWEFDGTPIWEYSCKTLGYHTEVKETPAVVVTEIGAALVRPATLIEVPAAALSGSERGEIGFPVKVWADKSARKIVSYYGVTLP